MIPSLMSHPPSLEPSPLVTCHWNQNAASQDMCIVHTYNIYIYVLYFHYIYICIIFSLYICIIFSLFIYIYTIYIHIWYIFAHSKAQICIYIFIYIYIHIYICIGRDAVCGCFPCTFFSRVPKCFFWNCVYQHKQEVWGRTRSNYTQSQGSSIFLQQGWRIQRGWNLHANISDEAYLEQPQKKGLKPVSYDLDDELLFEGSRFVEEFQEVTWISQRSEAAKVPATALSHYSP